MGKRNVLTVLQVRSAILDILLVIRYFCCKKGHQKVDFGEVTSFYQIDYIVKKGNRRCTEKD